MVAGGHQTFGSARLPEGVEDASGELGGHVDLPAQLAHVGTADGDDPGVPQVDLLEGAEWEGVVPEVGVGERTQDLPGSGPEHPQNRPARGDVGDGHAGVGGCVAGDPVGVAYLGGEGGHHQEAVLVESVDGQVGFDPTPFVEPCRVDGDTGIHVDLGGRDAVQDPDRVGTLDEELGQGRLVEQGRSLPASPVLGRRVVEPILATIGVDVGGLDPLGCVPVGAFPTGVLTVTGPECHQPVIKRRAPYPPGRVHLAERPVHGVEQPESFHRPVAEVTPVGLERLGPTDVDVPEIHGRVAADDPLGEDLSGAPSRLDADGVETGSHEVIAQLRGLAQQIAVVGCERLGAVEEQTDAHLPEQRDPLAGLLVDRGQVVPVLVELHERSIGRKIAGVERLGHRLEGPDEEATSVLLYVDAVVGVPQHRQPGG